MARTRTATPPLPFVSENAADRAVRLRNPSVLPEALRPGYDAILTAFAKYEAGDDEAARAALQAVSLQSPFLQWKVLLRGLMAYTAGDDTRARENWQRLDANRLPARVAAPLRAALDPEFKRSQVTAAAAALDRQLEAFTADGLLTGLRQLRADLSRDRALAPAFRRIEQLFPAIKLQAPQLVERLKNCFYRSILMHGEPADLNRYRKVFGTPVDDPAFHRLEALVHEDGKASDGANQHWIAYEEWLGTNPAGWSVELTRRARAMILHRIACQTAVDADDPGRELREMMSDYFGRTRARRPTPPADPAPLWRRAVELAPDWEVPSRALFERLLAQNKSEEAERVALQLLEHNPTALGAMNALAEQYALTGRAAEALELRNRALAANPFDKVLRHQAAYAHLAVARWQAINGRLADAERTLDAGQALGEENAPAGYFALRSTIARKAGRTSQADTLREQALSVARNRHATIFCLAVDAVLLKLKPADKRVADAALTEVFTGPATPMEVEHLYGSWDIYNLEGIEYRGQKSQLTKLHALVLRTPEASAPVQEYELLARRIALREEWKLVEKLARVLYQKFPENPVFPLLIAEIEFEKADGMPRPHRVAYLLRNAARLAERSPEPRHRELLETIRRMQEEALHPVFMDDFF